MEKGTEKEKAVKRERGESAIALAWTKPTEKEGVRLTEEALRTR